MVLECDGAGRVGTVICEIFLHGLKVYFARYISPFLRPVAIYLSSIIAKSHGPSVNASLFEAGFPSSRFVPAL
jgi:hypothetical protein